jgi:hypothetical protein
MSQVPYQTYGNNNLTPTPPVYQQQQFFPRKFYSK